MTKESQHTARPRSHNNLCTVRFLAFIPHAFSLGIELQAMSLMCTVLQHFMKSQKFFKADMFLDGRIKEDYCVVKPSFSGRTKLTRVSEIISLKAMFSSSSCLPALFSKTRPLEKCKD